MESLYRYAARKLSGARKVSADSYAAMELVQDAIDDTLEGRVSWDCFRFSLKRHLKTVLWRQIHASFKRANRLQHVSIDELTAYGNLPLREEMERALRAQLPDDRAAEYARNAIAELRRRAQGDTDVLALIDAKADDRTSRADARAATGFSVPRYRATMRRLNRLVDEVGIEIHLITNGKEGT